MGTGTTMVEYYARRAAEYEDVYRKPERQSDLVRLTERLAAAFPGMDVLEVACGTGYWTRRLAKSARRIVASDVSDLAFDLVATNLPFHLGIDSDHSAALQFIVDAQRVLRAGRRRGCGAAPRCRRGIRGSSGKPSARSRGPDRRAGPRPRQPLRGARNHHGGQRN